MTDKPWHHTDLGEGVLYLDGKPIGGVKSVCLGVDRGRAPDRTIGTVLYRNVPIISYEIKLANIEISVDLVNMLLGLPPRTVGGHTLRQCLAVAENIAMGAWAVRCAEGYLREARR